MIEAHDVARFWDVQLTTTESVLVHDAIEELKLVWTFGCSPVGGGKRSAYLQVLEEGTTKGYEAATTVEEMAETLAIALARLLREMPKVRSAGVLYAMARAVFGRSGR